MPDWSLLGGGTRLETAGADTSDSEGTDTAAGAADTKTAWVEMIASSSFDAHTVVFTAKTQKVSYLADFAVGAAASEQTIISNLMFSGDDDDFSLSWTLPLFIPAGSRLAVRKQSSVGSSLSAVAYLIGKPLFASSGLGRMTSYGPNTADSGGVEIDPGGVANTKGSWVQIDASTANPMKMLMMTFSCGEDLSKTFTSWLFDIAVGSGGSEQVIVENFMLNVGPDEALGGHLGPIPINIPAGSRIAVRSQCDITGATDRVLDVSIYGFD